MTPYSLVYGGEAVLPLEKLTEDQTAKMRLRKLDGLEEKWFQALQKLEAYQARISRAFDKRVKRSFKEGDLVLAVIRPMNITHQMTGKFEPKWEGPYMVKDVYSHYGKLEVCRVLNLCRVHCFGHSANKVFAECPTKNTRQNKYIRQTVFCRVYYFWHSAKINVCRVYFFTLGKDFFAECIIFGTRQRL